MSQSIKGILFDLEGTVIDVEACHHGGFLAAATSYGIQTSHQELINLPGVVGAGDPRVIAIILEKFGRKDIDPEEFRLRKMETYNRLLQETNIALRPGFADFCLRIKEISLPIAMASLTPRQQADILIQRTGLNQIIPIEHMVFREDVENLKPDPEVFLKAAERIGISPYRALAFGDSIYDMEAAKAAGCTPIAMPCNWTPESNASLTSSGAAHIFRDWRSLSLDGLLAELND